jgi:SH3-like domain-containing protein
MQLQKQINCIRAMIFAGLTGLSLLVAMPAQALEFRSVNVPKAILYDAPSLEASKLFLLTSGYPVEVIVNLGEWIKIRDHYGALSWIQGKQLSPKRMALVLETQVDIRQSEDEQSPLVATVEKDVVLEVLTPLAKNGWVKVKHKDGLTGYIQATAVWGL